MLGLALRRALAEQGSSVLQLVRRPPASSSEFQWDPSDPHPLPEHPALHNLTAAIHLSGASVAGHRWTPAWKEEMRTSRVNSTRTLATALAALPHPPRTLLVASAIGIYGNRSDHVLTERSTPGSGFLAELCKEWEAASDPARLAGIRVVHLRFGVVLHPSSGALAKMLPLFRLGLGGRLGSGRQWMSWISLADTVSAALFALHTQNLAGPVNITAPNPVTNAGFTQSLARAVHRPAILPAPAFALRLALGQMADEALLASARVHPACLGAAGFQFAHPTLEAALAALLP